MSSKLGAFTRSPSSSSSQHQGDRAGHRDEAELHAEHLAERHAEHGQQEPADHDGGEQLVGNVRLDPETRIDRLPAVRAKAVDIHRAERDREGHHQDRERRRSALLPDEVHELGAGDAVHHLRRQIAQQQRGSHEVGTEADHQHDRRDRQFQRTRERQRHRRHHQDDDDVVDEHRDHARRAPRGSSPAGRVDRPTAATPAPTASSARRSCRSSRR